MEFSQSDEEECTALQLYTTTSESYHSIIANFALSLTSHLADSMLGGVVAVFDLAQNAVQGVATLILTVLHLNYVVVNSVLQDIKYIVYPLIEFGHGISQPLGRVGSVCVAGATSVCNVVVYVCESTLYTAGWVCQYFNIPLVLTSLLSTVTDGVSNIGITLYSIFVPIKVEIFPAIDHSTEFSYTSKQDGNENTSSDLAQSEEGAVHCFIQWIADYITACVHFIFMIYDNIWYYMSFVLSPAIGDGINFIITLPSMLWQGLKFSTIYCIDAINVLCSSIVQTISTAIVNAFNTIYICLNNCFTFFTDGCSCLVSDIFFMSKNLLLNTHETISEMASILQKQFNACVNYFINVLEMMTVAILDFLRILIDTVSDNVLDLLTFVVNSVCCGCIVITNSFIDLCTIICNSLVHVWEGVVYALNCYIFFLYNLCLQLLVGASNLIQIVIYDIIPQIALYLFMTFAAMFLVLASVKILPVVVRSAWFSDLRNVLQDQVSGLFVRQHEQPVDDEEEIQAEQEEQDEIQPNEILNFPEIEIEPLPGGSGVNRSTSLGAAASASARLTESTDVMDLALLVRASDSVHQARNRHRNSGERSPENMRKLRLQLAEERDQKLCSVCLDSCRNVVLIPCKHMCVCEGCIIKIIWNAEWATPKCPLCRTLIQDHIVVNT